MTVNGKSVSWQWIAVAAIGIAGFFISGWVTHVDGFEPAIQALEKTTAEQGVTIKHMAKQVDDIHGMIFEK